MLIDHVLYLKIAYDCFKVNSGGFSVLKIKIVSFGSKNIFLQVEHFLGKQNQEIRAIACVYNWTFPKPILMKFCVFIQMEEFGL